jgi:type IV pilus assembly protein PilE
MKKKLVKVALKDRKWLGGFSLVELMIVMAIIAILSVIGINGYATYKQRAYNTLAKSTARDIVMAQEAYFMDSNTYTSDPVALTNPLYGLYTESGIVVTGASGSVTGYSMSVSHIAGNRIYTVLKTPLGCTIQ